MAKTIKKSFWTTPDYISKIALCRASFSLKSDRATIEKAIETLYAQVETKPGQEPQERKLLLESDFPTPGKPQNKKHREFITDYLHKEVCTFISNYAWHHDRHQGTIHCTKRGGWMDYPSACLKCPDINTSPKEV